MNSNSYHIQFQAFGIILILYSLWARCRSYVYSPKHSTNW